MLSIDVLPGDGFRRITDAETLYGWREILMKMFRGGEYGPTTPDLYTLPDS